jgi:hypothetical protein
MVIILPKFTPLPLPFVFIVHWNGGFQTTFVNSQTFEQIVLFVVSFNGFSNVTFTGHLFTSKVANGVTLI